MTPTLIASRYTVLKPLGEGGMGVVSLVEDTLTGRKLALKVLGAHIAGSEEALLQFKQEFRLMTRLDHPNVCKVYDYGVLDNGQPYFTMEVVEGRGLDELVPVDDATFVSVFTQLMMALGYLHQLGFVHCDLKSENVRVKPDGTVKLMDFGLMERAGRAGGPIKGTLGYMAPEMAKGGRLDARTDLYSAGALGFEMLTGRLPFVGNNAGTLIKAHLNEPAPSPGKLNPGIAPEHEAIVLKLLAKEPQARFASAYDVLAALGAEQDADVPGWLLSAPLIGRDHELATLEGRLTGLKNRKQAHTLLVTAPMGFGKTRLLGEFRAQAQLDGVPFVEGAAEAGASAPYGTILPALRGLVAAAGTQAPAALAEATPVLKALLPELPGPVAPPLEPKQEKIRLMSAIAGLFAAVGAKTPLVLALENWESADTLSQEVVGYIRRNTGESAVLTVITARPGSGVEADTRLELSALAEADVTAMIAAMLGSEAVEPAFAAQVAGYAEGSPLAVEALLDLLVRQGTLAKRHGAWDTAVTLTPDQMPASLQNLLLDRLGALPEAARQVAGALAVLAEPAGAALVRALTGLAEDALFDALAVLAEHTLTETHANGAVSLASAQLAELLASAMAPEARRPLHARAAAAIAETLAGRELAGWPMPELLAVTRHAEAAGDQAQLAGVALEAGRRLSALFANLDAERVLKAGLTAFEAVGGTPAARLDYLRLLADTYRQIPKMEDAKTLYNQAIPLAEELGERKTLALMLTSLAKAHQVLNQYAEAASACERSASVALAAGETAVAARCYDAWTRIAFFTGQMDAARAHAEKALELAKAAHVETLIGETQAFLGYMAVAGDPDHLEGGIQALHQAIEQLERVGNKLALTNATSLLGNAQNMLGDFAPAWASFQRNLELSREIGNQDDELFALLNLAIVAFGLGRFTETRGLSQEALAMAESKNAQYPKATAQALFGAACAFLGDLGQVAGLFAQALDTVKAIQNKYAETFVLQYLLEAQVLLGQDEAALATAASLAELIAATGNTEPESLMHTLRARVQARRGDPQAADASALEALKTAKHAKGNRARAHAVMAELEGLAGRVDDATAQWGTAVELAERLEAAYLKAELDLLQGKWDLTVHRAAADAERRLGRALEAAEKLETPLLKASALYWLAATSPHTRKAKQQLAEAQKILKAAAGGLTDAERESFFAEGGRRAVMVGDLSAFTAGATSTVSIAGGSAIAERLNRITRELVDVGQQYAAREEEIAVLEKVKIKLEQVSESAQEINQIHDPLPAIDRTLRLAMELVDAERGALLLDGDTVSGQALVQFRPDGGYQADWAYMESLAAAAKKHGDAIVVPEVREKGLAIVTAMALPVRLKDAVVGHLYLDRETNGEQGGFDPEEAPFVSRLLALAVTAIHNAGLGAAWIEKSQELEMLNVLAQKINETLDVSEVLELVVKLTLDVTKAERGFLMLVDDTDAKRLSCKAAFDREGKELLHERISMSICTKVLETGQAVTVVDATEDEEFQAAKSIMALNLRTLMCVPLIAKGKRLGVLYVDSQAVVSTFDERNLALLKAIASHAAGAIENATLYSTLNTRAAELEEALEKYRKAEHEAFTDMLTGLHNRRYFQQQSSKEIEVSRRHKRPMSVIMVDVDHFKQFNDTYGHAVGDEVLKAMGRVLPQAVRVSDLPVRFGGEEFVVLCPGTDAEGTLLVAERIRESVMEVKLNDAEGKPVRQLTASLGIASLTDADEHIHEVLERADVALYACKAGGRNQCRIWRADMPTPEELKKREADGKKAD